MDETLRPVPYTAYTGTAQRTTLIERDGAYVEVPVESDPPRWSSTDADPLGDMRAVLARAITTTIDAAERVRKHLQPQSPPLAGTRRADGGAGDEIRVGPNTFHLTQKIGAVGYRATPTDG